MEKQILSIIIPAYNEGENIKELYHEIKETCILLIKDKKIKNYEIIFINDGSRDNTQKVLEELKKIQNSKLKIVQFRKNFGQTATLKAGFDHAIGDLVVTMDGDLQNDPRDIPRLLMKLNLGYDVVSGWRYNRKDKFLKKISSRMMNNLRRMLIGDNLHDYGCSLKIYRRECLKDLELFGELHRYITGYLYIKGYRIGEIKVNHRPRKFGKTKYKQIGRGINGILDLFYLKFWAGFSHKPLHFFGRLGIYQWILAALIFMGQLVELIITQDLNLGPLFMLAIVFGLSGLLFMIFGFLSESISRIYFTGKDIYSIKKVL